VGEASHRVSEKNEGSLDEEDEPFLLTGHEPLARPAKKKKENYVL
jgi:hypothetical protein